jgi:hypothetical protein
MLEDHDSFKRILGRFFKPGDKSIEYALAILTGRMVAHFHEIGKVEIVLTDGERAEYLAALMKAQQSWFGFPIAHYMSDELEALVCGHRPDRYRRIS